MSVLTNALMSILPFLVIVALTLILVLLVPPLVASFMRRSSPQIVGAARALVAVVIALIGGTLALQALGLDPYVILLLVALLGVATLLAMRDPLANYGAKYFTDIYTPFKVGDTVEVQGYAGKVIEINSMTTVLLSEKERLVSVPNSAMLREVVVNTTPQAWKEVTIPVTINGGVDLPAFESDLLESLSKLRIRLDPRFPPVLTTKSRTAQSTDLVLTLMLRTPEDRDTITAEVNKRVAEVLQSLRGPLH